MSKEKQFLCPYTADGRCSSLSFSKIWPSVWIRQKRAPEVWRIDLEIVEDAVEHPCPGCPNWTKGTRSKKH